MAGINSTEVSYGFGQFGSTISQLSAQFVKAPEDHVIVAIQFLSDTKLSHLFAADQKEGGSPNNATDGRYKYLNHVTASHAGKFTRQVNQGTGSTNKIKFDDGSGNPITNATAGCNVGDVVYDSTGARHGVVIALNPDGDDESEIMIDYPATIADNEILHFSPKAAPIGGGGQQLSSGDIFPKGITIYGRWDMVSINDDDPTGGIICYFGR